MKIALVIRDLNIRGGTQKQLLRLAEFLRKEGHDVKIFTQNFNPHNIYRGIEEFTVKTLPLNSNIDRKAEKKRFRGQKWGKLDKALKMIRLHAINLWISLKFVKMMEKDVEIINLHDLGLSPIILFAKMLRPRAKIVWQINDLPAFFKKGVHSQVRERWYFPIMRGYFRFMTKLVDRITVNVTKNKIRAKECLGVEAEVYYCGIDRLIEEKLTRKPSGDIFHLVSTGVFFRYRNYETILSAMKYLRDEEGIKTDLTVIGSTALDSDYAAEIMNLANHFGLTLKVLGEVSDELLREVYRQADAFVFVNLDQSWGLAIFEAMSCSLPVIISNNVGATEILNFESGAILVDPKNSKEIGVWIKKLYEDHDFYKEISRKGSNFVSNFTWDESYSSQILKLFQRLRGGP